MERTLREDGVRVETDLRNETINYKVREHSVAKVPVLPIVGEREVDTARSRCDGWVRRHHSS